MIRHILKSTTLQTLILALALTFEGGGIWAQTGPGGVGNGTGANGQPRNMIWFDASSLGLGNSTPVETWTDISGNSNHSVQPTASARPEFRTNQLNGQPAIVFDGTTDFLPFDGNVIANSNYTVMFVGRRRINNAFRVFMSGTGGGTNLNLHLYWENSNQFRAHHWGNDLQTNMVPIGQPYSGGTNPNVYGIFTTMLESTHPTDKRRNYQNNSFLGSINDARPLTSWDGAAIGTWQQTGFHPVDAAEVIIYRNALNTAQLQIVNQYLAVKYGITIANSLYAPNSSYLHGIVGIGQEADGNHSESSSAGMYISDPSANLTDGQYVFASHNNAANSSTDFSNSDLPAGVGRRFNRIWSLSTVNSPQATISFAFNEAVSDGKYPAGASNYVLLYRAGTSGDFAEVKEADGIAVGGKIYFNLSSGQLQEGYYTLGTKDETASPLEGVDGRTWYTYMSGNWDNWQVWSLEAGGSDIVNPDDLTPSTSPTASIDRVVILAPYQVTVNTNGKGNKTLEIRGGTLDLGSTTSHTFGTIEGQGTIKLSADNFPTGDATIFSSASGGTLEYYGSGFELEDAFTFNNLKVNLTNTTDVLTLLADYTLNGNLTVERGIFRINNNSSSTILNLDIAKDVEVSVNGQIAIGEGNTIGTYSIPWSGAPNVMPAIGQYHSIFHQVRIGGNLTNNGSIRFTNQAAPHYGQFTNTGAATVTFYGAANKRVELNGTTDFYNLIINKGVDRTFELEVYAENANYFGLYGPNNVGRLEGAPFSAANPEVRKALWIRNGTLRLTGSITIPTLSEGNLVNGNGDYPIPGNARLWIDGPDVRVYTTAMQNSPELHPLILAQTPTNQTNIYAVNHGSGNQALSVLGEYRITNGFFSTRNSAGFIFWASASAEVVIQGGVTDVSVFRSTGGTSGRTSFNMSGGNLYVRGNVIVPGVNPIAAGEKANEYPIFGIVDPEGVFQMSGGTIHINDITGNNDYNSNGICINATLANHSATEGTFNINVNGGVNVDLLSTGSLYNLTLNRLNDAGTVVTHMGRELSLNGSLSINANTQLVSRRQHSGFNGQTNNLTVARSFTIAAGGDYRAINNTTNLLVSYSDGITLNNTNQEFFNLLVRNNPSLPSTRRTLGGNANMVTIHNNLTIEDGAVFRHATKSILVKGNITNSGTIELAAPATGRVILTNRGIVSAVSVGFSTNFTAVPTVTFAAPPAGGTQATGVPIFDGIPSGSNALQLIGILITNSGSGYTSAPAVSIVGGGGMASTTVTLNTQHELSGNGNGVFGNLEVNEPHPSEAAGKVEVTYLTSKQTVSGTLTLTHGVVDLRTHNLDVGSLSSYNIADYSATKLFRMAGNHGDGGLTLTISANSTYLYPIGTYNTTSNVNRYAYANPTFSDVGEGNSGKVQINAVPKKLPTLGASSPDRYLIYYWRTRFSNFSTIPRIHNLFNSYVADYVWDGTHTNYKIGKVVGTIRYGDDNPDNLGTLEAASGGLRLLNFSVTQVLEDAAFTAAFAPYFNGTIQVFYSKQPTFDWYNWNWNDGTHWSFTPHGEATRPNANDFPKAGDIAIIGYGDHSASGQHSIRITSGTTVTCAEIRFASYDGGAASRLVVYSGATLNTGLVTGNGTFMTRINLSGFPTISADFSEFSNTDVSVFNFYLDQDGSYTIPTGLTSSYPNVRIEGGANRTATIQDNVLIRGNLTVDGDTEYLTNSGLTGDLSVNGTLFIGGYLGGNFSFNTSGSERIITVGNITLRNNYPGSNHRLRVLNSIPSNLKHRLIVKGGIEQLSETGGIDLFTNNTGGNNVVLEFIGESNNTFTVNAGSNPELYRLILNKGSNTNNTFSLNSNFTLNGPTDGNSDQKALQLQNGTLILNHPDINITLNSGGQDFIIGPTTGLTINQGTARVTAPASSGIFLDGYLTVSGEPGIRGQLVLDGGPGSDNYILYSSSGNARIDVLGGRLEVGSQIRSSTLNNLGVLRYRQLNKAGALAGEVIIGTRSAPVNTRGIFEVMNPGSQFQFYNGTITIARGHNNPATATRAAVFLNPASPGLNEWNNLYIGNSAAPAGGTITINSTIGMPTLTVDGNTTAKLEVNSMAVVGNMTIQSGSTFDGSSLNLTLQRNITNNGTANLSVDSLKFIGNTQTITGSITADNIMVDASTSVTVLGATTTVTANKDLVISRGALSHGNQDIIVKGNVTNNAIHTSTGTGNLVFAGTTNQFLGGIGEFGRLRVNNPGNQVRLQNSISLNQNLILANGILNIQNHRLSLGQNALVVNEGDGFSTSKMVISNGAFGDLGIRKSIGSGPQSFTLPIGVNPGAGPKYTRAEFDITANASAGNITVYPIDQAHMTADCGDVLQYYWNMTSSGVSGLEGTVNFHFHPNDVVGNLADYYRARLEGDSWTKVAPDPADNELVDHSRIEFTYGGVNNLDGDYTAGTDACIPDNVPVYYTISSGDWSDKSIWQREGGGVVPDGGPQGHIVRISSGHTVSMDRFRIRSYRTIITGRLEVGTQIGHHLGFVSGTGTLAMVNEKLYPGDYSAFLACGSGGTMEFGGAGSYELPNILIYNNLTIAGSGTKTSIYDSNFTVCGNLLVKSGATFRQSKNATYIGDVELEFGGNYSTAGWWTYIKGTASQTIKGSFTGSNAFKSIRFMNSTGYDIEQNIEIFNNIRLESGRIRNQGSRLSYNTTTGMNLEQGGNEDMFIEGNYRRLLPSSPATNFHFPVGKPGRKKVTRIINPTTAGNQYWSIEYFSKNLGAGFYGSGNYDAPLETISQSEYWVLNGPNTGTASVQFTLTGTSDIAAALGWAGRANLRIVRWNHGTSKWEIVGGVPVIPATPTNLTSTTITSGSPITFNGTNEYFTLASIVPITIPTATFSSINHSICELETTSLFVALSGNSPWEIKYTDGTTEYSTTFSTPPYEIENLSPASTTTYTLTAVKSGATDGNIFGDPVTISVYPTPTIYNVTGGGEICGAGTGTIGLSGSDIGVTYELWFIDEARTVQTQSGTGSALAFTNIVEVGTYEIRAYNTSRPSCAADMNGTAEISLCVGVFAEITNLVTDATICEGEEVTLEITFSGTPPFTFSLTNNYGQSWLNRQTDGTLQGTGPYTFNFTVPDPPIWVSPNLPNSYTYTITTITDNNSVVGAVVGAGQSVNVWKRPQTGPQYHIPNTFGQ